VNPAVVGVLVAGAVFGLAVGGLVIYWLVPQRVSLHEALTLDRTMLSAAVLEQEALLAPATPTRGSRWVAVIRRLEDRLARWRLSTPDEALALIEWTRGRFLLTRVGLTLGAVLIGPLFWLLTAVVGAPAGFAAPQGLSLLIGLGVWYGVGAWVTGQAAARRLEMREALISYLTLLALYKASGEGMLSALQQAATTSDAWTFRRIDARLAASLRAGLSPQAGLRQLGEELGISEIGDVADIAATASLQGAGVFTTLLARAEALRNQMQSDAEAEAAGRSVQMGIPKVMLVMAGIGFLMYPLIIAIAG
jgi:hypothetical protein